MSRLLDLKKNRNKMFESLTHEVEKLNSKKFSSKDTDDRFWKPTTDKAGNGYAVIRFLPSDTDEKLPWVKVYNHGFQNKANGAWLIEPCPTTANLTCPVCESNAKLWNSGIERNKGIARDRKRKLSYISNILVVSDPACPENEGKVFLFKFGKKIFDKISEVMFPEYEDERKINPFCVWEGANFKLKVRKFEGYPNYDKSSFEEVSSITDDDSELEHILESLKSLDEFVDPKSFKSYNDLKSRLDMVLAESKSEEEVSDSEDEDDLPDSFQASPKKLVQRQRDEDEDLSVAFKSKSVVNKSSPVVVEDDDEMNDFLRNLADED